MMPVTAWPKRSFVAACLLGLRVRVPPGARVSVSCVSCEFKDIGFYDGPINRPEEFNRAHARVCVCVRVCVRG